MLNFVLGRSKSGKTARLFEMAKEICDGEILFIVPEQHSFTAEKAVLEAFGAVRQENISVLSFTGICNELSRLYGGRNGRVIDDTMRYMLVQKSLTALKGELKLLNSDKNAVSAVIEALTEIKQTGADYSLFSSVTAKTANSPLGMKLHDITLIGKYYDALIANIYIDPLDDLQYALLTARDNGYFKNKHIFFDGFSAFNGRQLNLINQMLSDAFDVTFAFCTDYDCSDEFGIFANINSTVRKISAMAKNSNVTVNSPTILNPEISGAAQEFENSFFGAEYNNNSDALKIICAENKYDETEFVANTIRRLVRTENYRYRDFTVIARDCAEYVAALSDSFKKYQVPLFCDKTVNLGELPLSAYLLYAIKASRNFNTKEIYKFLKSGRSPLTDTEISLLDEYVYLWNINGKDAWISDFTANPYGLKNVSETQINEKLLKLNTLRKKVVKPLLKLNGVSTASAKRFCKMMFELIEENAVADAYLKLSDNIKNTEYSSYISGSWEAINNILDGIFLVFGDTEMSFGEFYDILENCINNYELRTVPQGLDDVITVDADRFISSDRKITFVLGNNYDEFPKNSTKCGFFSVTERAFLKNYGIEIADRYISDSINEEYLLYRALTSWQDKLYLSYHNGNLKSGHCDISPNLRQIAKICKIDAIPAASFLENIETPAQLFSFTARKIADTDCNNLVEILAECGEYGEKIEKLKSVPETFTISADIAEQLYGKNISLSASKVEDFYKCKYKYFLKYGLRFSSREQIAYTGMQRGTIAHYVLENAIRNNFDELCVADAEKLRDIVDFYIEKYLSSELNSGNTADAYQKFLIARIAEMLYSLLPQITDELKKSQFKPEAFELEFGLDKDLPPLKITAKNGMDFNIFGAVDRLDSYFDGVKKYVRITDYKTGVKNFNLSDILFGLNLQLFIYMCAISENFDVLPAAAVYQPINPIEYDPQPQKNNAQKPKGILTSDAAVLNSLDPTADFLPFSFNNDGTLSKRSSCVSVAQFSEIMQYTKKKLCDMANDIADGKIDNNAYSDKICAWCEFRNICNKCEEDFEEKPKISNDDVLKIISEANENGA